METTARSETPAGAGKSSVNPDALNQLLGQMVNDLGAAVDGALVVLGDGLGIYTALADIGPATSQELAKKTNLHERQLREWLSAQAASGYVSYDAASEAFFLTAEQVAVFADPNSNFRRPGRKSERVKTTITTARTKNYLVPKLCVNSFDFIGCKGGRSLFGASWQSTFHADLPWSEELQ
jgi:hypothetical protein